MPTTSKKQHDFMAAVEHSPSFSKKVGVPQRVGAEFMQADNAAGKTKHPDTGAAHKHDVRLAAEEKRHDELEKNPHHG